MNLSQLAGSKVYLDTNIFIYAFETENRWTSVLRALFRQIEVGTVHGVTSELTIAEVLVKPLMVKDDKMVVRYSSILGPGSGLELVPVSRLVLEDAARIRAGTRLKLFDAIHVASAKGVSYLITNDERLSSWPVIGVHLSDLADG